MLRIDSGARTKMVRARAYLRALTKWSGAKRIFTPSGPYALAKLMRATAYLGALAEDGPKPAMRTCQVQRLPSLPVFVRQILSWFFQECRRR